MNKSIIKQSIAIALASSLSLSMQADDKTIVVTANQMKQDINDTLTDVEVIEREDIERIQPQSFVDLLVNIAGIDTVQKGGQGSDTSIFSRGTNSNQLLILIDGVRVGSATLGSKSVANISISQIERIEIVKGPRAALWGSDAIGGVIQIFTRRYQTGEHRVAAAFGSNGTQDIDASVGFGSENFSNTLTYSYKKTDGIDAHIDDQNDDDGFENDSLAIRGNYKLNSNSTLDWLAQADEGESEFDTSWGGNITSHNNYLWNIRYTHQGDNWKNQFSANSNRDQNFTFGNGVNQEDADVFETRRQQFNYLTNTKLNDDLSIGGGLEYFKENVEKSSTGYGETERVTQSAFINANYAGDSLLAELALRYDDVEKVASNTAINVGLGYRINKQNQLSVNFGEGFKAPTFNDLYYPWGGNPTLQFETSENREVVYKGFYDIGNLVVSIYDSEIENLIQWVPDNDGIWTPQNVGKAEILGVDASFKIQTGDYNHKLTASYVDTKDASTNSQLLRRAKKHLGYDLSYMGDSFDWFVQVQHVGERPDNDFQTFMSIKLDAYTQFNIGASYTFDNHWQLKLKVTDAFDKAATQASGYRVAGREFYVSLVHQNLF